MNVEEYKYHRMTAARATLENFLSERLDKFTVAIKGDAYHVRADGLPRASASSVNLRCIMMAHPVLIQLEARSIERCFPAGLSVGELNQLPEDLQTAALHIAFDDTFAEISRQLGDSCALQALEPKPEDLGEQAIAFSLHGEDNTVHGVLRLSHDAVAWFAQLCQQQEAGDRRIEPPNDFPVPLHLELARLKLPEDQLRLMEKDDIILFPEKGWSADNVVIKVGAKRFYAQLDKEGGLSVQADLNADAGNGEWVGEEDVNESQESGRETGFQVYFEFPEQRVSLAQLRQLELGKRVMLAPHLSSSVFARVGDRLIAQCELIAIQNRRGARVVSLKQRRKTEADYA